MRFLILILAVLLYVKSIYSQDTIYWSKNNKLSFLDFKSVSPVKTEHGAVSSMNNMSIYKDETMTIISCFIKSQSWIKYKNDLYLLNHEQRHFDLYEVGMRIIRKEISNYLFTYKNFQKEWNSLIEELNGKYYKLDSLYDLETKNPTDVECQEEWNRYIDQMLKELEAYSNLVVKLRIKEE